MDQCSQARVFVGRLLSRNSRIALSGELTYSVGDCIVEAPVQRSELVDGEGSVALDGEVSDRLAKNAVVMNHLVERVPQAKQFLPMRRRANSYLR